MAATSPLSCSSAGPSSALSVTDKDVGVILGKLVTPRKLPIENPKLTNIDLVIEIGKVRQMFLSCLDNIYDYALQGHDGVKFTLNGIEFSPEWFENITATVRVTYLNDIMVDLDKFHNNTAWVVPLKLVSTLGLRSTPKPFDEKVYLANIWPNDPEKQVKLAQQISETIQPVLGDIAQLKQLVINQPLMDNLSEDKTAIAYTPDGLMISGEWFDHLSHTVIVQKNGKIAIFTGRYFQDVKFTREVIDPTDILFAEINSIFGKVQYDIRSKERVSYWKWPSTPSLQNERLQAIKTFIEPYLDKLKTLASSLSTGIRFSKSLHHKLHQTIGLTRSGEVLVFTGENIAAGCFKNVRRLQQLFKAKPCPHTISTPNKGTILTRELSKEALIYKQLEGCPGFLQPLEMFMLDSCGVGAVHGLVTEELPYDGVSIIMTYFQTIPRQEKIRLKKLYITQLIDAVETLHNKSIYHRDLKIDNLLMDTSGRLIVTDFGFAYNPLNPQRAASGAINYRPPEIDVDESSFADKRDAITIDIKNKIIEKGSCEWLGNTYYVRDLPFLPDIVERELSRATDIWALFCTIYALCYERLIPGVEHSIPTWEAEQRYKAKRRHLNNSLLQGHNFYNQIFGAKELINHSPVHRWLYSMAETRFEKRPQISEIKAEWHALLDRPEVWGAFWYTTFP